MKNLQGECQQCGGLFEFPAEAAGIVGECPHCGQQTECVLAPPPEERPPWRGKAIVFSLVAAVILIGGMVAAQVALKRAQHLAAQHPTARSSPPGNQPNSPNPFAAQEFSASPASLELTPGTSLLHARGVLTNLANRQRFGVKVELELLDATGQKLGNTSDYVGVIEPKTEWKFDAPVTENKAASSRVVSINETK